MASECLKVELSAADQCTDLKVSADLSGCADKAQDEPKIQCHKSHATVTVNGQKAQYRIKIKRTEGTWGASAWQVTSIKEVAASRAIAGRKVEVQPAAAAPSAPSAAAPTPTASTP